MDIDFFTELRRWAKYEASKVPGALVEAPTNDVFFITVPSVLDKNIFYGAEVTASKLRAFTGWLNPRDERNGQHSSQPTEFKTLILQILAPRSN